MRQSALTVAVVALAYLATCNSTGHISTTTTSLPSEEKTVLRPVPAALNEETYPAIDATETQIKGKAGPPFQFRRAQFIDETHGWASTSYSLYRTIDGGKTWERLPQEPEKDARFTAFSFVDESRGWLAIVESDSAKSYGLGYSSVIMFTDDGGRSWKLQARFQEEIVISDVLFSNENDGFAVGIKGLGNRADRGELFVISTSNGGNQWRDTSAPAKAAFKNQWGVANDSGKYLKWTSSAVFLLTQGGRVMSTTDRGKTWNTVVIFEDERPEGVISSTAYHKVALDSENRMRVIAAGIGDEGYWGDFVINEDGRWTSYEVQRTPILDAVFLTDKDVVACGLNVRTTIEKPKRFNDAGVIVRSFDGGKSWQTIYRSKTFETFFYITKAKDNSFYAVSDAGTFLRFTLPQ